MSLSVKINLKLMTRNSTLIYQIINKKDTYIINLQELLKEESLLKNNLKSLKNIRLRSPQIEIIKYLKEHNG